MKGFKRIISFGLSFVAAVSFVACNGNSGAFSSDSNSANQNYENVELNIAELFTGDKTIAAKEYYQFERATYQGFNLEYTVKDSSGAEVELNNYGFIALDTKYDVTVKVRETGESHTFSLKAQDLNAPIVSYFRDYRNTMINESVDFIIPTYHDNIDSSEKLTVVSTLYYGDEVIKTLSDGETSFVPDKTGKYVLRTTVADTEGNTTSIDYTYNVVDNAEYANKLFYLDEEEGVNCMKDRIASVVSHNTDLQYCHESEKGSTKIFLDGSHLNPRIALNYPLIDLNGYTEIYFWIYNDADYKLGLFFNMTSAHIELQPKAWAKFTISVSALQDVWTTNQNQFELADITGLQFFFHGVESNEQILETATVYFSAIYAK